MSKTVERVLIECPVCGQRMKRITATHLKKHNMTMAEFRKQYGDIIATEPSHALDLSDPGTMKDLMSRVMNYIATDEQIDGLARQTIHNLMRDQDPRLRIALNTVAVRFLGSFNDLYEKLESIRTALLNERRLAGMSDANLIKTSQVVERSILHMLDYLKSMSIDRDKKTGGLFEQTNVVNIFSKDPDAPPAPDSSADREKIRSLVHGIIEEAKRTDGHADAPVIVDAEATVVQEIPNGGPTEAQAPDQRRGEGAQEEGI